MAETKEYTELQTPTLVNTDAEQTVVKQLYSPEDLNDGHIDCGQRALNSSNRTLINVNADNVEIVFDQINNGPAVDSGNSETVIHLTKLYRDLPKELFIGRVMPDNNSDESKLKDIRTHVYIELKN